MGTVILYAGLHKSARKLSWYSADEAYFVHHYCRNIELSREIDVR